MERIKSISKKFRILFILAFLFIPTSNFVVWILYDKLPSEIRVTLLPHTLNLSQININSTTKILASLIDMLQVSIVLYALYQLIKLFKNYGKGEIFSLSNVTYYRKLGYTIFAWVLCSKIVDALISAVLTFQNPVGQRQIVVSLGSSDLLTLAIGGLVILIAWIMNEGHKLNEEQSLTI
jgi:Protein of unknown function (DUF2975)